MSAAANKPQEFDHQDDRGEQGSAVPGPTSTSTTTAIDGDEPLAVAQAATTTTTTTTPGVKVDENPAREAAPLIQTKDLATPASSQPPAPQPLLDSAAARLPEETGGAEEDATAAADPAAEADPSQGSTTNAKESDAADTEAAAADLWKEQADDLLAAVGDPDLLLASSSHRTSSVSGAIPLEREHNHHPEVPALPVAPPAPAAPPVSSSATPDNNNNNSNNENDGNEASRKRKDPPTSDPDDNAKDMGNVSNGNDDADGAGTAEGSSSAPNSAVTAAPPGSGSSPKRRATPTRVSWEDRLNQLKQYKSEHGDLLIPIRFKPNPSLGKFVHNTREQYKLYHKRTPAGYKKKCSLTAERLAQLEEIGFVWNTERTRKQNEEWEQRLEQLQHYKAEHGDCLVPHGYKDDPSFAEWIHRQRTTFALHIKEGRVNAMIEDRMQKLEAMGFNFRVHLDKWSEHFAALQEYRDQHGHCMVPTHFVSNMKLGRWVHTQRFQRRLMLRGKKSSMTEERVKLLEELGFSWEVRPGHERPRASWQACYDELADFYKRHGHHRVPPDVHPQLHWWCHEQKARLNLPDPATATAVGGSPGSDAAAAAIASADLKVIQARRLGPDRVKALADIAFTKDVKLLQGDAGADGVSGGAVVVAAAAAAAAAAALKNWDGDSSHEDEHDEEGMYDEGDEEHDDHHLEISQEKTASTLAAEPTMESFKSDAAEGVTDHPSALNQQDDALQGVAVYYSSAV